MPRTKRHAKSSDELRKKAEERIARQLGRIESGSPQDIPRLLQELRVHQVELEVQNEELRMAQAELETSRSKYAHLYDFAPVAYLTINKDGVVQEANLTAAGLLGVDRKALVGRRASWFVAPEDSAVFHQHMIRTFETGVKQTCQFRLAERKGEERYVQMESLRVEGAGRKDGAHLCGLMDVTCKEGPEQRLRETERSFRTLAENSPDVIARFDRNLRYIYVNPAIELHSEDPPGAIFWQNQRTDGHSFSTDRAVGGGHPKGIPRQVCGIGLNSIIRHPEGAHHSTHGRSPSSTKRERWNPS